MLSSNYSCVIIVIYSHTYDIKYSSLMKKAGCPRSVMVKVMDCGILVSYFKFQSHYCLQFRTNTLGKSMNPLTLPTMG